MPDLTAFYANNLNAELGIIYNNSVYWEASGQGGIVPQGRAANPAGYFIGFSNRATNDEKLAAILYMEWMARPEALDFMHWGRQGANYTVNSAGVRELTDWRYQGDMRGQYHKITRYRGRTSSFCECPSVGCPVQDLHYLSFYTA